MKIKVPNLPEWLLLYKPTPMSITVAVAKVTEFLSGGNTLVVTGAGYHELVDPSPHGHSFRCVPPKMFRNPTIILDSDTGPDRTSVIPSCGTLSQTRLIAPLPHSTVPKEAPGLRGRILELHGTLHVRIFLSPLSLNWVLTCCKSVHCRSRHSVDRSFFQKELSRLNPAWKELTDEMQRTGTKPRANPDGDVDIQGINLNDFVLPVCETCQARGVHDDILKPAVIFFGESIPDQVKCDSCVVIIISRNQPQLCFATGFRFEYVDSSDRVLFVGTTLATYSAFRLLKHALEMGKPVMMLNLGPTRAHDVPGVDIIEAGCSQVLRGAARALTLDLKGESAMVVERLLESGVVTPLPQDDRDTTPR
ncbi:NAD-dependent protein deacetylase SIR4 [Ceratobasidium theobromae]|uniref:NAD-dependent protein deacetylase SIR4 n=1 Tax=Ceratobasidium theobromae TaxID=1582974 RepID=A0A5N5QAN5_9AGAM|nr:NAD-dependent protein deacetylase SIR4 [Ceratobasidium theobromae]